MSAAAPVQDSEEADEERFTAASNAVAAAASIGRLDNDALLHLYGLYKQATEGPCTAFRPSFFNQKARSKWCAHCALGQGLLCAALMQLAVPVESCCSLMASIQEAPALGAGQHGLSLGSCRAWRRRGSMR